jgi:hypothetical protein
MNKAEQINNQSSVEDIETISQDALLEVLSNQRRRFTIRYLKQENGRSTVSQLTEQIASWENNKRVDQLTYQDQKRVRNALRQFHLPKMDDYGFIDYDSNRGTVNLTTATANTNFYVDSLTGGDIPWGLYYLGFSALSLCCLLGFWIGVYPFTFLSPLSYAIIFMTALTLSSIVHFYDNYYRMRLGASNTPPEINNHDSK